MSEDIFLKTICGGFDSNFTYLIGCPKTKKLALIDASVNWSQINKAIEEARLAGYKDVEALFLTHTHFDHIASIKDICKNIELTVYIHPEGKYELRKMSGIDNSYELKNNEIIKLGEEEIKAIFTPGHQPDCVCFIWRDNIFTGDTLFVESAGRCDLPKSNINEQIESMRLFANVFPDDWKIYPGHDYGPVPVSSVSREKQFNPFVSRFVNK